MTEHVLSTDRASSTLYAKASGAGRSGVAVFRLSGPGAIAITKSLIRRNPLPRRATMAKLICPDTEQLIDEGLVILFKGPASFTGEDVVEFHLHGSAAIEAALYETLGRLGARAAEPGAFTRRAFENGKLDLAQVEALADLIDSETAQQRLQALGQLEGRLSRLADGWRGRLLAILAPLEADVDFPDEGDVPAAVAARAGPAIEKLMHELKAFRAEAGAARAIRDGFRIAIMGQPNAGKSSLLNYLAGSDHAIVSDAPGTTRDIIEVRLDLAGVPVALADTAGLRSTPADDVEREGMRRALSFARQATLRIMVIDPLTESLAAVDVSRETLSGLPGGDAIGPDDFIVLNKSDLVDDVSIMDVVEKAATAQNDKSEQSEISKTPFVYRLSAKTGAGVPAFVEALEQAVSARANRSENAVLTRARHVEAVAAAISALERALAMVESAPELAAEDARLAARALGSITGVVDVEDVLGEIFSSFCIGK